MNDADYIDLAARIALGGNSPHRKFHFGAVGIRGSDGAVVIARNGGIKGGDRSASFRRGLAASSHAEARLARKLTPGSTIYVARVLKSLKKKKLAKPCRSCLTICRSRGITRIVYTIDDITTGAMRL